MGRGLVDGLYGFLLGVLLPWLYLNESTQYDFFVKFEAFFFLGIVFVYVYLVDDYFCCQRLANKTTLYTETWKGTIRFWLDIFILGCAYGITLSRFNGAATAWILLFIFLFSYCWCSLLLSELSADKNIYPRIYCEYLKRQQMCYFWGLSIYVFSRIIKRFECSIADKYIIELPIWPKFIMVEYGENVVTLLWVFLIAHWFASFIRVGLFEVKLTWLIKIWYLVRCFFNKHENLSWLMRTSFLKCKENKYFSYALLIFFGAMMEDSTIVVVLSCLLSIWLVYEFFAAEGMCYNLAVYQSIEMQLAESDITMTDEIFMHYSSVTEDGDE